MTVPQSAQTPLLSVRDLTLAFRGADGNPKPVVQQVSFELDAGRSLAVVGESGSGKTMIGKALLGLLPDSAQILGGNATFAGRELLDQTPAQWRALRGVGVGMVFQEPMVSLNPAFRIGTQLTEALTRRRGVPHAQAWAQAVAMLERVRVRDPQGCMKRYPHEFSGGMRQRIMLAAVMLLRPKLLIADEPTTALDCVVQKEVLDLMTALTREEGTALIFISHNLALVAAYTEQVLVMRAGVAVENGPAAQVLSRPSHPYTLALLDALPRRAETPLDVAPPAQAEVPRGAAVVPPVLEVRNVAIDYPAARGGIGTWLRGAGKVRAVHSTSFSVRVGETLAIVGESGSGKTSLTKAVLGLVAPAEGEVLLNGEPFLDGSAKRLQLARRAIQIVFQDPYSSLDPRMRVSALVAEGLRADHTLDAAQRAVRVSESLADVGLADHAQRFVHELSGGQRQRVAIARALASRPAVIIADEPVSALDVTVQKQVLDMLVALQARYGFACLLISHDLGVVEQIAQRVLVMLRGHIVEEGTRDAVFDDPCHPYTRRLLQAVPELRGNRQDGFKVVSREVPMQRRATETYFDPDDAKRGTPQMIDVMQADARHRVAVFANA
ncbi:dipeptide ABC transporter ATP-binding protein [Paraburkholderia megapolitana]|uniref:Peptide/nickel transport system ATP-binding protein n=1 Tax=Paraburkholderia megapolitana TaxID=420953 RepID=A0A1I3ERN2_9BURK|nr:ABC transporter ATP-binding protein [Paraburkholderia megapolitana]QDQ80241.1 ABC transporter ATP-binding protein [Paraburkholderia megapolitana]SFI01626.1 peptide/nickel transport system ATP-binding protein [Paraburkholderia megapolitana]